MSYKELFDTDLGTPPVPSVDVDQIMARQDRRARYRKLGAAGALGVLLAASAFGYSALHRAAGSAQSPAAPPRVVVPTPTPSHTPTTGETAARLTLVLAELPASLHVPAGAAFTLNLNYPDPLYNVAWTYGGVHYAIEIMQGEKPNPRDNACSAEHIGNPPVGDCKENLTATGDTIQMFYPPHVTKNRALIAQFTMADVTNVSVSADAGTRLVLPKSLMTTLIAAAQTPGFTLHPHS